MTDRRRRGEELRRRDDRLAVAATPIVRNRFRAERREVLAGYDAGDDPVTLIDSAAWNRTVSRIWLGLVAPVVWQDTIDRLENVKAETPLPARVQRRLARFIQGETSRVTDRTVADLLKIQRDGGDVRTLIADLYSGYVTDRAQREAFREVLHATASVQHQAAREAADRREILKDWNSVGDDNVRPDHEDEDSGGPIPLDQPYPYTGLDYPRDPTGPPDQTENCRCWEEYVPAPRRRRRR